MTEPPRFVAGLVGAALLAGSAPLAARDDARAEIRVQRASFNRAIAGHDMAAIGAVLADNAQVIRGTGSGVISGKEAQLAFWETLARSAHPVAYVRTPERIELSKVALMAFEIGSWRGGSTTDWVGGRYAAKWRRIEGSWRIESETFMTADCGGTLCPK